MRLSRCMLLPVSTMALVTFACLSSSPGMAQEAGANRDTAPDITGTGKAGHIAAWTSSTNLGNSKVFQSSAGNVGIGTTAPAATLEVSGDAQVDGNVSLSGSILLNGVGQLIWAPNNGSGNFSAGLWALPATTTGTQNTAVGDGASQVNTTGYDNTAIGNTALAANTTGYTNTAIGAGALAANTIGSSNTAIGQAALYLNTIGFNNTAVGNAPLRANTEGSYNTAIGVFPLISNTTGTDNTALGNQPLLDNTTGSHNIGIGFGALSANTTGSNNIAIGYEAGFGLTNATGNNIDIGNQGALTDSGTIRIGTPFSPNCTTCQTSAFIAGIYGTSTGLPGVTVVVDSNGNLGTISSSRRYKEDIQDMGDATNGLMHLRPVSFRYKKAFDDGSKPVQYGLIAEEVADVYPDLVARSADGQIETVKYQVLGSMLLNELQKQNTTIAAQKEQIRSLEERLAKVESALSGTIVAASSR